MAHEPPGHIGQLVVVLGDQLDAGSTAFDSFDPERDAVWMAEVAEEATHVPSHKARIVLFLSAMRHFRDASPRCSPRPTLGGATHCLIETERPTLRQSSGKASKQALNQPFSGPYCSR